MKNTILMQILLGLIILSCGKDNVDEGSTAREGSLRGSKYLLVAGEPAEKNEEKIKGEAAIVFKEALGEIQSDKRYTMVFSVEEGGSIRLVSHANETLESGVELNFTRQGAELSLQTHVGSQQTSAKVLAGVSATKEIALVVEAHNSEDKTHILIWRNDNEAALDFSEHNALFNSELDAPSPGNGKGKFWGFVLKQASLTEASSSDVPHHHHH